ncbi:MAG: flotillin [Calditrichaeota bacterium]|nr:flotillin [Calditrichota bacterium]
MNTASLLIILGVIVVVIAIVILALAKQYRKVGPNEVLIISGGRRKKIEEDGETKMVGYRIFIGGGGFVMPFTESAQVLPLEIYSITIKTPEVLTKQGVHIIAEASAQIKVASNEKSIRNAAEQFLSSGSTGIKEVSGHILEGYVRSAIGAMTVEEVFQDRDGFADKVRDHAQSDFEKMGLELISFNLGDISDTQGYLAALGQPRIAQVKRDAAVAHAETEKDTIIKSALARKEGDVVRFQVETDISSASKDFELKKSEFQIDINTRKAKSDAAYDLERHKQAAYLKRAEYDARLVEKEASIKVEEQEIRRRELELEASVKRPAEARKFQVETEASAEKFRLASEAEGRASAHTSEGFAEVEVKKAAGISRIEYTRKLGVAEADAMTAKADAYKSYNDAAVTQMLMDKLPELARAVSEPMSRIEKMIVIDSGEGESGATRVTKPVAEVLAQLPAVIESLSGLDLKKILNKATESKDAKEEKKD